MKTSKEDNAGTAKGGNDNKEKRMRGRRKLCFLYGSLFEISYIFMDNDGFHNHKDIIKAISDHKCILEFLPPYSPDLNPIEKMTQGKDVREKYHCSVYVLFVVYFLCLYWELGLFP